MSVFVSSARQLFRMGQVGGGGEQSLALLLSQMMTLSHQTRKKLHRILMSWQPGSSQAAVLSPVGEMTQALSLMLAKVHFL